MDFISKQFSRVGKQAERFQITFKPLVLKVNVYTSSEYYIIFKRGPQQDQSKKYKLEPISNGLQMQQVVFEDDVFTRVSSIYKEKDNKYQVKKADILIRCVNQIKEEKVCDVTINLSEYIGRGYVKDTKQLTGSAYFLEFEIGVEPEDASKRSDSTTQPHQDSDASDDEQVHDNHAELPKSQSVFTEQKSAPLISDSELKKLPTMGDHSKEQKTSASQNQTAHQLEDIQKQLKLSQSETAEVKKQMEVLKKQIAEMQAVNEGIEKEKEVIMKELEVKGLVTKRWSDRCEELEKDVAKLKKESADFYDTDRFESNYTGF